MSDVQSRLASALTGRYRVERELGAGGMATVFLAHDERHGRDVAIKVVHPDLGAALGAERFLAEIKTTAKLQHPHILPLLDSGEADGLLFYVMPYVKGETLRARLQRETQLPVADALAITREVADALAEAHAQGIVHRDIKPENILLQGGHAIVADFGIALAVQQAGGARMTQTGLSLGTPQYMAPEQAMGDRNVDHRVDQYALGAVTYEMLTGEPPHTGPSAQAIVAKLLSEAVRPATVLRPAVPAHVDAALQVALAKLPADRFAGMREFMDALRGGTGGRVAATAGATSAGATTRGAARTRAWVVVGATLVAFAAAGGWWIGQRGATRAGAGDPGLTRFPLVLPFSSNTITGFARPFTFSPDGQSIVYAASVGGGASQLFRRRFDALQPEPIAGTTGATEPAFSPDGKWIVFAAPGGIMKVQAEGGTAVRVVPLPGSLRGLTWASTGDIIYALNLGETLLAVSPDGGTPRPAMPRINTTQQRWPVALPDGRILFTEYERDGAHVVVRAGSLTQQRSAAVGGDAFAALGVVDGHLVYLTRTGEVKAAPIDLESGQLTGPSVLVDHDVLMSTGTGDGFSAVSPRGDLIFRAATSGAQLLRVTPAGVATPILPDTLAFEHPRASPDGSRIAMSITRPGTQAIWILEVATGILSPLSPDNQGEYRDRPEWSPDGRTVYYRVNRGGGNYFAARPVDRSADERPVPSPHLSVNELVPSPDGRVFMARTSGGALGAQDVVWWNAGDTVPHFLTNDAAFELGPRFSPDGRWFTYTTEIEGRREAYVGAFPGPGGNVQVSRGGASPAVWSRDGRTLYYGQGGAMMAATMRLGAAPTVESTRVLFRGDYRFDSGYHAAFDVAPNGDFIIIRPLRESQTIVARGIQAAWRGGR